MRDENLHSDGDVLVEISICLAIAEHCHRGLDEASRSFKHTITLCAAQPYVVEKLYMRYPFFIFSVLSLHLGAFNL